MNYEKIVWKYIAKAINEKFWNGEVRDIPVVLESLGKDHLGDFEFSSNGFFNCIILSKDAGMTIKEMIGVLVHEMTHQLVFQKYGCEVEEHGSEWMSEIKRIGFEDESLDGLTFCDDMLFEDLMKRHDELINEFGRNN